jgi:hypothetical protein
MRSLARGSRTIAFFALVLGANGCTCGRDVRLTPMDADVADGSADDPGGSSDTAGGAPFPEDPKMKCPDLLVAARKDGQLPGRYVVPTAEERQTMRAAVASLLSKGDGARKEAADKLEKIGFVIDDVAEVKGALVLHEAPGKMRGGGAFMIRMGDSGKLLVQTPHTFFDEGTFPLGCEFFQRSKARALFINTMHRYKGAPTGVDGIHPSDVAHSATSLFQAATEGATDALGTPTVVQLHGFATRVTGAKAVISIAEKQKGNAWLGKMKELLEHAAGNGIQRYPDDTKELGATTNVQGMFVKPAGGRFFHMEMSDAFRRELHADPALREKVFTALLAGLESPAK